MKPKRDRARERAIDLHVGQRVRLRRINLGISQERLGAEVGLTFQQVQKYERGANRIGASRLVQFAKALDVPVSFFFDGIDYDGKPIAGDAPPEVRRADMELARNFQAIADARVRRGVYTLVAALRRAGAGEEAGR